MSRKENAGYGELVREKAMPFQYKKSHAWKNAYHERRSNGPSARDVIQSHSMRGPYSKLNELSAIAEPSAKSRERSRDWDCVSRPFMEARSLEARQWTGFCEEENTLYIVMEQAAIDLGTFLRRRRRDIDERFIKYHWKQMLQCVQTIHDRNILHGNLKPANFLLVKGSVKLTGFKLSAGIRNRMVAAIKVSHVNTFSYMAPEILQLWTGDEFHEVPIKADVWSLGCILHYMAYGRVSFTAKSQRDKVAAIFNSEYTVDFPSCSDSLLIDVLKHCLVRDVFKRAAVNELLKHPYRLMQDDHGETRLRMALDLNY
ncbi:hypothetical protein TELCIR_03119 [Teladorsagia circumcincta]|uniref:Protein kinase domain-containing protein n=1 Tax=Teladorsagia circumcincta TaxID=45464 RepID=A0A2G9UX93_TELCI|nr:hypothetical protein TELCIR_03119 [Teladorsagia circumcincta]